jgi:hypothetical protein
MISRRNIRVKVMQLLYMIEAADSPVAFKKPVEELQKQLDKSRELFVYLLYFLPKWPVTRKPAHRKELHATFLRGRPECKHQDCR